MKNPIKDQYQKLRRLSWEQLWTKNVPAFDSAGSADREANVALIRALAVVCIESDGPVPVAELRQWFTKLLNDPSEKVRRYAVNALPKLGADPETEDALLEMFRCSDSDREKKVLTEALDKIGGARTLELARGLLPRTEQKARAAMERSHHPGDIRWDAGLHGIRDVTLHLRTRCGLEEILADEVREQGHFRIQSQSSGWLVVVPLEPFTLRQIFQLRCFGTAGFFLGVGTEESLPALMTSPLALKLLQTFTEGTARYRLDFVAKGHQRSLVKELASRAYAACPEILNDPRQALWSMDVHDTPQGLMLELRPRRDLRFAYRRCHLPAASHPPLAAAMARLGGALDGETVWDPFCGSGVELVECALPGKAVRLVGSDLSAEALDMAKQNASGFDNMEWICSDFRDLRENLKNVGLIITNPPLGMRVPIPKLRELFDDLFDVAAHVLRPGGRLVLINPHKDSSRHPSLQLQSRRMVDMSGFRCWMELYLKP